MGSMRETCGRCGKNCLGFFWKDGVPFCGGASTPGCGQEVGATLKLEADRKAEAFGGQRESYSLRNHGHQKVTRDQTTTVLKSGKVKVRKMTAADRKRFGLPPVSRKKEA